MKTLKRIKWNHVFIAISIPILILSALYTIFILCVSYLTATYVNIGIGVMIVIQLLIVLLIGSIKFSD